MAMFIGENGELVISGQTEVGVVSHYLSTVLKDVYELDNFTPPLILRKMGWLAFAGSRVEDFFGTSDTPTHTAADPRIANLYAQMIAVAGMPTLPFRPQRLGRKAFLLRRLSALTSNTQE